MIGHWMRHIILFNIIYSGYTKTGIILNMIYFSSFI